MSIDVVFKPEVIGNVDNVEELVYSKVRCKNNERKIITKSFIDARKKDNVKVIYRVDTLSDKEFSNLSNLNASEALPLIGRSIKDSSDRPVIVGFGPAGMYAGLVLARYGLQPIIIEKGSRVDKRSKDVNTYRTTGQINVNSNIQFGEGGAGTFSDGKLYTGVSSGLKGFIGDVMVKYGAPSDITFDSHPHVGTDNLVNVVSGIREEIISLGGEVLFDTTLEDIVITNNQVTAVKTSCGDIPCKSLMLAIGHSSRETVRMIYAKSIAMENKPFSVGVRIEHLRRDIDIAQYGFDTANYKNIYAANYKLAVDTCTGKKLYTFCMCPGGEVIAAASEKEAICTNGMSYRARDGRNSNAALLVPVNSSDYGEGVLDGMLFQEQLEKKAFQVAGANYNAPISTYGTLCGIPTAIGKVTPTYIPGITEVDLREVLPKFVSDTLIDGIAKMGRKIRGYDSAEAILTAVEARSSSPVRILRDKDTYESVNTKGLYLSGEGAGYAGGIMSSAIDGIKCANRLAENMLN